MKHERISEDVWKLRYVNTETPITAKQLTIPN